jgi:redox-sensitive bicupin YhaK (pirin superfamily)
MFQLSFELRGVGLEPGHERRRFTTAERRKGMCVVASPDGREGSLRLHQDIVVCSAILRPGQRLVHPLSEGQTAWLHVVEGNVEMGGLTLATGDGVAIVGERVASLTAVEPTELLMVEIGSAANAPEPFEGTG